MSDKESNTVKGFIEFKDFLINVDELQYIILNSENELKIYFHVSSVSKGGITFVKQTNKDYNELCQKLCTYKDFIRLDKVMIRISCILFIGKKKEGIIQIKCKNNRTVELGMKYDEAVEIIKRDISYEERKKSD